MLANWQIKSFKAIREYTNLRTDRIMILCGANSSGKSSVIQTLLMVGQTHSSRLADKSLLLNGHLAQLGTYTDLKNDGDKKTESDIGFTIKIDEAGPKELESFKSRYAEISIGFRFGFDREVKKGAVEDLSPEIISCMIKSTDPSGGQSHMRITKNSNPYRYNENNIIKQQIEKYRSHEEYSVEFDENTKVELLENYGKDLKIFGAKLHRGLPVSISGIYDENQIKDENIIRILLGKIQKEDKIFFSLRIPQELISYILRKAEDLAHGNPEISRSIHTARNSLIDKSGDLVEAMNWYVQIVTQSNEARELIFTAIRENSESIRNIFRSHFPEKMTIKEIDHAFSGLPHSISHYLAKNIKYLGPLRDEPRAIYPLSPLIDPTDVGLRGENTAAVFNKNKDEKIEFISPESIEEGKPSLQISTLEKAVMSWLHYLGVVEKIKSTHKGKLGYELSVKTNGAFDYHDLTHVGVGVSQVLPIVIMCLLSKKGNILIFEQPELHLHPKVQARIADLFLSLSFLEKQTVIETHSEYLINRLRLRIAESEKTEIEKFVNIYFSEIEKGNAKFSQIKLNEFGTISNWPKNFFDQTQNEVQRIMMAATLKKKKKDGSK